MKNLHEKSKKNFASTAKQSHFLKYILFSALYQKVAGSLFNLQNILLNLNIFVNRSPLGIEARKETNVFEKLNLRCLKIEFKKWPLEN
jgi:hypothetical protein